MSVIAGTIIDGNVVFCVTGTFIVGTIVAGTTVVFPARVGTAVKFEVIAVPFASGEIEAVAFEAVVFGAVVGAGVVVILNVGIVTGFRTAPPSEIIFLS